MHRFREQARSHIGSEVNRPSSAQPESLWEWACPRRGWHIQHRHRLMHRFREQARLCLDLGINSRVRGVDGKL
jgi:hypothetical protein